MKRILILLIFLPAFGWSQTVIVSGKVSDANNAIPGANIIEKGTSNGTTSDFNGNFEISVSSNNAVLVFSFIGYTLSLIHI